MTRAMPHAALIAAALGAAASTNTAAKPARNPSMQLELLEKNKQVVRTLYEDCINAGRLERIGELIGDDFVGSDGERGAPGFAGNIAGLRTAFPDIRFTLEDLIAEEDRIAVRWTWEATHAGAFRGFPASQRHVTNAGISIYQLRDGKVVRAWLQADRLGVLQQIGAIPGGLVPAGPPSKQ